MIENGELRTKIDELRCEAGHELASHSFPSVWLWKEEMGLQLCMGKEYFAVRAAEGENTWFFPCGTERGKAAFLAEHAGEPGLDLLYLRREDAAWLEERFPGEWMLWRRPDADEYLYRRDAHVAMEGGRYRHLRWRVHKIEREMSPRTEVLDGRNTADARQILDVWASGHSAWDGDDRQAALRALEEREALGLYGVVVYLEGRPASFMLGFPLGEDVFDAAVGKSAVNVQGLTYYTLWQLMRSLPERYRWFNLEEDLGLPGLRDMKEHFLPDGKHEVWEARRR